MAESEEAYEKRKCSPSTHSIPGAVASILLALDPLTEMDVGEHGHARIIKQLFAQLLAAGRPDELGRLGDVGPHVERAAG